MRLYILILLLTLHPLTLFARTVSVPPLPVPPYADTEVSTNIVLGYADRGIKSFQLKFIFECVSSNCIQVALGKDADGDGYISFAETGALYGWRNGRFFIENTQENIRYEERLTAASPTIFSFSILMDGSYMPKEFHAFSDSTAIFQPLSRNVPHWLCRPQWDMMRVTRRGPGELRQWLDCEIRRGSFALVVR